MTETDLVHRALLIALLLAAAEHIFGWQAALAIAGCLVIGAALLVLVSRNLSRRVSVQEEKRKLRRATQRNINRVRRAEGRDELPM